MNISNRFSGMGIGNIKPQLIKSVQQGTGKIKDESKFENITISNVKKENCLVIIQPYDKEGCYSTGYGKYYYGFVLYGNLTSNTSLQVSKLASDEDYPDTLFKWQVIEFDEKYVRVQHGISTTTLSRLEITVSDYDMSKSFIYAENVGRSSYIAEALCGISKYTSTKLRLDTANQNKDYYSSWYLIEFI